MGRSKKPSAKVKGLFGQAVPEAGVPDEMIVQQLELLLARAKTGEIIGFTCVALLDGDAFTPENGGIFRNCEEARLTMAYLFGVQQEINRVVS